MTSPPMIDLFDDAVLARLYELENGGFEQDLPFYLRYLSPRRGPVLECGAGTGRVALALAQRGFRVSAVERSAAMLAIAAENATALPPRVLPRITWMHGDLTRASVPGGHQAAIWAFNSLMHVAEPGGQRAALTTVHRALAPGGLLLMELGSPYNEIENPDANRLRQVYVMPWSDGGSTTCWEIRRPDFLTQTTVTELTYDLLSAEGLLTRRRATLTQRWLFPAELALLLEHCGFELLALHGDYESEDPWRDHAQPLLVVARKAGAAKRPRGSSTRRA